MLYPKKIKLSVALVMVTFSLPQAVYAKEVALEHKIVAETIQVELKEWMISLDKNEVKSGVVTFQVTNRGVENHEFVVIKTDRQDDSLPTVGGKVDEALAGELIGEIEDFAPQGAFQASFTLAPGQYVLLCNIVEKEPGGGLESHYHQGMHHSFKVLP